MVEAEASTPSSRHVTQQVFAFDMQGDAPRLKIYIMPDARVRQGRRRHPASSSYSSSSSSTIPRSVLIADALAATGLARPWALVQSYLSALDGSDRAGHVEALGWDAWCRPGDGARQKAYVRFQRAGLGDVLRHLDLGGQLAGPRIREIQEAAREMWTVFLGPRGEEREEGSGGDSDHDSGIEISPEGGSKGLLEFGSIEDLADRTAGALLAYEMRLGMDEPWSVKCEYLVFRRMPRSLPHSLTTSQAC